MLFGYRVNPFSNFGFHKHPYVTVFYNEAERRFQDRAIKNLGALGIVTGKETARFPTPAQTILEDVIFVRRCFRQNGTCKFEERLHIDFPDDDTGPPLACRFQPFSPSVRNVIMSPECPQIREIASERPIVEAMKHV